jgi:hypothetical protein
MIGSNSSVFFISCSLSNFVNSFYFRENREVAYRQLQDTLSNRDLELALLQVKYDSLASELNELRRASRREGVNMDYLKNIILQVMVSFLFAIIHFNYEITL